MAKLTNNRLRSRQLSAIHAEKKRLQLDDETYRMLLQRVASVRSAADLDAKGRADVLREFASRGGTSTAAAQMQVPGAPQNVREDASALVEKIAALLADASRSWNYAHAMARRMFRVQRVEWLHEDQLHKVVAALTYDQMRRQRGATRDL